MTGITTVAATAMLCHAVALGQSIAGPTTDFDKLPPKKLVNVERSIINSPPAPTPGVARPLAPVGAKSATSKSLSVPTSTWTYGATATAAGMVFAYYDRNGFANMYTGPANGGVCPLTDVGQGIAAPITGACSIIATQNGFDGRLTPGHVDDYWVATGTTGSDPWEGVRPQHVWGGCTADFMGSNQWKWDFTADGAKDYCSDGSTAVFGFSAGGKLYNSIPSAAYGLPQTEGCHGLRLFAESRGYTVLDNYTQKIDTLYTGGFSFADYVAEIDAGYPVIILLAGHAVVGVGYDTADSTVYLNDCWDNAVHTMTWGGSYAGYAQRSVMIIHLVGVVPGSVQVTLEPAGAVTAGAQWKLDSGGSWQDSGATLADVPGGLHTISYKEAGTWNKPYDRQINVSGGSTTIAGTYFQLCQGVDDCGRAWPTTGNPGWLVQSGVTHDGVDAAQSGNFNDDTSSTMSTQVDGPTTVGFWWKVSSEADYDFLTFYVDGTAVESISGEKDWTWKTYPLAAGAHTLAWTYAKDGAAYGGADAGWVDQFDAAADITPPTGTIAINNGAAATNKTDAALSLTWDDGTGYGVARMCLRSNGTDWPAWEPVAAARAWTLPAGDGYKTVLVMYADTVDNRSVVYNDYILLDTAPPTGSILINGGASTTASQDVTLNLAWADTGAGVVRMRFSDNGSTWTNWESLKPARAYTLPAGAGYHTVRVQFLDNAGNYSIAYNDYIKLVTP